MRPFEHLPIPMPKDYDPGEAFFYNNFVQPFITDMIKMMAAGLHVDEFAVDALRKTVGEVLNEVDAKLLRNPIVQKYQLKRSKKVQKAHYSKHTKNTRNAEDYYKDYDGSILHRTWVVNTHLKNIHAEKDCRDKWSIADLKNYNIFKDDIFISKVIDKSISTESETVINAMNELAQYKADLWNRPRYDKANSKAPVDPFNPGSAKQKQEIFDMLNIEPMAYSDDTGEASWKRKYIEELQKQLQSKDKDLDELLQCLIDHSFSGIIQNNFIKAFDTFTIDKVMYGNIKLFGAKSFRNTSNSPNLLNMPSTASIYAKPLKRCFVAPEGYLIYAIDLSALEDRVIANLSGDENKINVFKEGLDGHSLNACGYFPEEVEKLIGKFETTLEQVKAFMSLVDKNDKTAKDLRQNSKPHTFKLAYGGFPDEHKGGVITQEIFDNYHNVLYPGITDYRENYVLPTAKNNGYIHLGLGCRLYSDNPDSDIRTINNGTVQFWSILTLIAINELNYRIAQEGLQDDIAVCSTIYDSIYMYVKKDAKTIKWLNDNAVEALCVDYLENQVVPNEAEGEIGPNWADLSKVPNNASVKDIEAILKQL